MKTLIKPTLTLLFFIAFNTAAFQVVAQSNQETTIPFSISIEIDGANTTLVCLEGCDWKKITLKQDSTIINENGISKAKNTDDGALFVFNVQKTQTGILLKNIKGTKWAAPLDISCNSNCTLVVNQFGLAQ